MRINASESSVGKNLNVNLRRKGLIPPNIHQAKSGVFYNVFIMLGGGGGSKNLSWSDMAWSSGPTPKLPSNTQSSIIKMG